MNHAANKTAEEKWAFPAKPVRKGAHKNTSNEKSGKDRRGGNKPQRPAFTNQVELLSLKRPTHIRRNSLLMDVIKYSSTDTIFFLSSFRLSFDVKLPLHKMSLKFHLAINIG